MTTARLPLVAGDALDRVLAIRRGLPVTVRQFVADVLQAAARLPERGFVLNVSADRLAFATGFAAAMLRGQVNVLPPNQTPDTIARLSTVYPDLYCLTDDPSLRLGLPVVALPTREADPGSVTVMPCIAAEARVAEVLTSGSTGVPRAHPKTWREIVGGANAAAARHAASLGRVDLNGLTLVATVPAQHMYGLESSILLALCNGAMFDAGRPFYPQDIADALTRIDRGRALVTTPFHLRTLLESGVEVPPLELLLCATAPLAADVAIRAEQRYGAPLLEIYGCTEAGQVASRRTARDATWQAFDGLEIVQGDAVTADTPRFIVQGGHLEAPVELSDRLELDSATRFSLGGRGADLVNIAGKRTSLAHLAFQLETIEGISDGLFHLIPPDASGVDRLVAVVVAPRLATNQILDALRERIDPVFLPRRVYKVDALPRSATGKLPAAWVDELVARLLHGDVPSDAA